MATYTLTSASSLGEQGGVTFTVSGSTVTSAAEGAPVTVEGSAVENYYVSSFTSEQVTIIDNTFTMPAEAVTVTANYTKYDDRIVVASGTTKDLETGKTYTAKPYTAAESEDGGGAVKVEENGTLTGTNVTFADNEVINGPPLCIPFGGAINNNGTVTLDGATFTGNKANGAADAGAIYNKGTLTINDGAAFISNTTLSSGGAIYNKGTLTINDGATFSGNNAKYASGGAIYNKGTLTINDGATFSGNNAKNASGGAIHNSDTLTINDGATFSGNSASEKGGAIFNGGTLTINDGATFSGNSASEKDGAIYNSKATITFAGLMDLQTDKDTWVNKGKNATIVATVNWNLTGGKEKYGSINGFQWYSNENDKVDQYLVVKAQEGEDKQQTGAYIIASGEGLTSKKLSDNKSDAFNLKAGESTKDITLGGDAVTDFQGRNYQLFNVKDKYITLAAYDKKSGSIEIKSGTEGNEYDINEEAGDLFANINNNNAISVDGYAKGSNLMFISCTSDTNGAAIYNEGGTLTITGTADFVGNSADGSGGAIDNTGTITINGDATFTGNSAASGGAIYSKDPTTITGDAVFTGNSATKNGGAVFAARKMTFGKDVVFTGNTATNDGGAIYQNFGKVDKQTYLSELTINGDATFTGNSAGGSGGAICIFSNGSTEDGDAKHYVTIEGNADFTNNTATTNGGAISIIRPKGEPGVNIYMTIEGEATFTGNTATKDGGAIHSTKKDNNGTTTVTFEKDATFTGNSATGNGGAIWNDEQSTITFAKGATFSGNNSSKEGGTIYNLGKITFSGKTDFSDNVAGNGDGGAISNGGDMTFNDEATFTGNSGQYGGAISSRKTVTFEKSATFTGNKATGTGNAGGAIENFGGTFIFKDAVTFTGNSADNGGAIYNENNYDLVTTGVITFAKGATFNGNSASQKGGAIYNSSSTINFAGTMDLQTAKDGWYNDSNSKVNWDISGGLTQYGSITHFELYTNADTTITQTITVTATQAAGDYVLATGDLSDYSKANNGKYNFKITGVGGDDVAITVGGTDKVYGGNKYSLALNGTNDKLTLTVEPDKLPVQYTVSGADTYDYDGNAKTVSITVSEPKAGAQIWYSTDGKETWEEGSSYSLTDAGSATVYFKVEADGYKTAITEGYTITIDPKDLTVEGTTVAAKVYDGTADADVSAGILKGVIGSDDVKLEATGSFADKNAEEDKTVTVTYSLSGDKAGNYKLVEETEEFEADIYQKKISVSGTTVENKEYDGNTTATVNKGTIDVVAGDDVTLGATGTFDDKNAGTGKDVTVSYSLSGTDAKNYELTTASETVKADITQKALTVFGTTVADKIYDGNTTAEVTAGTLQGVVGTEDVTLDTTTAAFADKNAGSDKTVTVSYTLTGADVANYTIADEASTADIDRRKITLESGDATKKYDGTPLTKEEVTATNIVVGEGFDYSDFASQTDVGSTQNTFKYKAQTGTNEENYIITVSNGSLIVTAAEAEVKPDSTELIVPDTQTQEVVCYNVTNKDGDATLQNDSDENVSVGKVEASDTATVENNGTATVSVLTLSGENVDIINHNSGTVNVIGDVVATGNLNITNDQVSDGRIVLGGEGSLIFGGLNIVNETGNTINGGIVDEKEQAAKLTVAGADGVTISNEGHLNMNISAVNSKITISNGASNTLIGDYTGKNVDVTNNADGAAENVTLLATGDLTTGGKVTLTGEEGSLFKGDNKITALGNLSKINFSGTNTFTGKLVTDSSSISGADAVIKLTDVDAEFKNAEVFNPKMEISGNSKVVCAVKNCNVTLKDGVILSSLVNYNATIEGNATLKDGALITLTGEQTLASGKTVNVTGTNTQLMFEKDKTLTNNGTINVSDGAWFFGAVNGTFVNGGIVNVDVDGAVYALITTNTGTINLKGGTFQKSPITNSGTVNWDLTNGLGKETTISWATLTNDKGKLTITVNADDKIGDSYTLAENAAGATGMFTLKGIGTEETTITIGGEAVYNGYFYTLGLDTDNNLVFTADRYANPKVTVTTEEKWFNANNPITIEGTVLDYVGCGIESVKITGAGLTPETVTCTVSDPVQGLSTWSGTFNSQETMLDGTVLTVTATDKSDPVLTGMAEYTLKADGTGPVITVTRDPQVSGTVQTSVTVTASATDALSGFDYMTYAIDNGTAQSYTAGDKLNFTENSKVTFTAYDKVGNVSTEEFFITDLEAITITADSDSKMYDGSALTNSGYTFNEEALIVGDVLTATVKGTITNVGEKANVVTDYQIMRGDVDVTSDYIFNASVNGTLTVTRRDVTLTSESASKVWDGTPLVARDITVSGSGWVEGEGATYITGSQTEVGTSFNTIEVVCNEGTKAGNYVFHKKYGTLTVTEAPAIKATRGDFGEIIGISDILFQNLTDSANPLGAWMDADKWKWNGALGPAPKSDWTVYGAYDFTGDGVCDIMFRSKLASTEYAVGYYDMGEGGTFKTMGWGVTAEWELADVGDFNGNGVSDILWKNSDNGYLGLWMDGTNQWVALPASALGAGQSIIGMGDVNNDGCDDILINSNGVLGAWDITGIIKGTGETPIWSSFGITVSSDWATIGCADFDGNGKADIVLWNDNGYIGTYMNCDGNDFRGIYPTASKDEWGIPGFGDYDGDGSEDVLVRNLASGALGYWDGNDDFKWHEIGSGVDSSWAVIA